MCVYLAQEINSKAMLVSVTSAMDSLVMLAEALAFVHSYLSRTHKTSNSWLFEKRGMKLI
uniref:Uncharacterized protein n=1 Tax=Anguilla anguilla TaxID=7936 RepID=A0A0E9PM61_ANGAN